MSLFQIVQNPSFYTDYPTVRVIGANAPNTKPEA